MDDHYYFGRKVLVTGAGGFIGSHLVEELVRRGAKVRAFVHYNSRNDWGNIEILPSNIRKHVEIVPGDVQDAFSVQNAVRSCEIVFHLAALIGIPYSYVAPESYVNTNVKGTLNVLQACLTNRVSKLIHTSTSEVYGTALYVPIDEKHPLQGQSPYSASKIGADQVAQSYYRSFHLPVVIVRPFNTYGPRQSARAVIPTIISQVFSGKKTIRLGSVVPIRDLCYVADTLAGFLAAGVHTRSIGQVINFGSGEGVAIKDLVERIGNLMSVTVQIKSDKTRIRPQSSEVMRLVCDNAKARELIGWRPKYSLEEGLKETIKFIEQHIENYKTDIYNI